MPAQHFPNPYDPQPIAGSHADSVAPQPPTNFDSDITDELTDHLALSARDLQLAGNAPGEAEKLAHQKFGDVAAIRRRLWWINQGDEIMLRTALAIVCAVLIVAVAALGIGNWRMSRTIDDLHESLVSMNENQKALAESQKKIVENVNRPMTIRGRVYFGDPSKAVPFTRVELRRNADGRLIDQFPTNVKGRFETGSLPPGEYYVVAPLVGLNPTVLGFPGASMRSSRTNRSWQSSSRGFSSPQSVDRPLFGARSKVIELSPFAEPVDVELDVRMFPVGQLSFEPPSERVVIRFKEPAESSTTTSGRASSRGSESAARVRGSAVAPSTVLMTESDRQLTSQLRDKGIDLPDWLRSRLYFIVTKDGSELPSGPGVYTGVSAKRSQVWPVLDKDTELLFFNRFGSSHQNFQVCDVGRFQLGAYIMFNPTVSLSMAEMTADEQRVERFPPEKLTKIEIKDGKRTHLRVVVPEGFEDAARQALAAVSSQEQFDTYQKRVWPLQIEAVEFDEMVIPQDVVASNQKFLERLRD